LQWLPYRLPYQLFYVAYRWVLVLYFFIWMVMAGTIEGGNRYFIYLTNWAHMAYNTYLIIAALSTTWTILSVYCRMRGRETSIQLDHLDVKSLDYWNMSKNRLSWYQIVHWVFYSIGNELALCIMILYWTFLYRGEDVNGVSANTHLLNGILSLVDMWICGLPIYYLHVIYLMIFATTYSIFSGIYFLATGGIIYVVLNYRSNPGTAVGLYLGVIFLLLPVVHLLVYLMYLVKQWVVYRVCRIRHVRRSNETTPTTWSSEQDVELASLRALSPCSESSESS
jgi:hypothetical protein